MKVISTVCVFVLGLLLGSPVEATPVTWTFSGIADSGHWNADPLAGLAYVLRLSKDVPAADFDLGDWSNLTAEIDVDTLGTHVFAFCTTSMASSCLPAPFQFIETFSGASADTFHFRGPQGVGDSRVNVPLGTLGPDDDLLTALGPVTSNGDGLSHIIAQDGVPSMAITPVFQLLDTDSPTGRITVKVTVGGDTSAVPEGGSTLALFAIGAMMLLAARRAAEPSSSLQ
jgi:hypothetical protein